MVRRNRTGVTQVKKILGLLSLSVLLLAGCISGTTANSLPEKEWQKIARQAQATLEPLPSPDILCPTTLQYSLTQGCSTTTNENWYALQTTYGVVGRVFIAVNGSTFELSVESAYRNMLFAEETYFGEDRWPSACALPAKTFSGTYSGDILTASRSKGSQNNYSDPQTLTVLLIPGASDPFDGASLLLTPLSTNNCRLPSLFTLSRLQDSNAPPQVFAMTFADKSSASLAFSLCQGRVAGYFASACMQLALEGVVDSSGNLLLSLGSEQSNQAQPAPFYLVGHYSSPDLTISSDFFWGTDLINAFKWHGTLASATGKVQDPGQNSAPDSWLTGIWEITIDSRPYLWSIAVHDRAVIAKSFDARGGFGWLPGRLTKEGGILTKIHPLYCMDCGSLSINVYNDGSNSITGTETVDGGWGGHFSLPITGKRVQPLFGQSASLWQTDKKSDWVYLMIHGSFAAALLQRHETRTAFYGFRFSSGDFRLESTDSADMLQGNKEQEAMKLVQFSYDFKAQTTNTTVTQFYLIATP